VVAAPEGTVTLLFTDIEGSTRLLRETGDGYAELLLTHRRLLRKAFQAHGGYEVDTEGDGFFVAFATAHEAIAAAAAAQEALAAYEWPEGHRVWVRMGVHTGEPRLLEGDYIGLDVHHAARVMAAGHGGQVLVSQSTCDLLEEQTSLRDLGEHRLKDLSQPQRLYQLQLDGLPREFPPLKSLHQTSLPVQPTPLIGRERELGEVLSYLRGGTRLLTLTGTGGTGKTRLALHAAAELADDYPDGVWFVPLAPISDSALVEATIAQTLGLRGELREELQGKRLLLVLDNLEQLLDAAPAIASLLAAAPKLVALVTSRERLAVAAEQEYQVPSLAQEEGVELFVERACRLRPGFTPDPHVEAIVSRLDGLPLAIELAAARSKVLTAAQIEERLSRSLELLTGGGRDAPERQRTLRATIQWSYDLLNQPERHLLAALAVFAGSFPLDAAETICEADLDTLQSLIDKSLLRATEEGRFFLLETIRDFASTELLLTDAEDGLRGRLAHFVLTLAEADSLTDSHESLALEQPNLRAALDWAQEHDGDLALRICVAARHFWYGHGLAAEGSTRFEHALFATDPSGHTAAALSAAGQLAQVAGNLPRAFERAEAALAIFRRDNDERGMARTLTMLATLEEDPARAKALQEETIDHARAAGDDGTLAVVINNSAYGALKHGETGRAVTLATESLASFRQLGAHDGAGFSLLILALASMSQPQATAELLTYARGALQEFDAIKHVEGTLAALDATAIALVRSGTTAPARRLLEATDEARAQIRLPVDPMLARWRAETLSSTTLEATTDQASPPLSVEAAVALALEQHSL
jgi:predicted ATPase/class 3 adenylate cyclase